MNSAIYESVDGYEEVNLKISQFILYSFIQTSWVYAYMPGTISLHVGSVWFQGWDSSRWDIPPCPAFGPEMSRNIVISPEDIPRRSGVT
jgi:hypothetical protein